MQTPTNNNNFTSILAAKGLDGSCNRWRERIENVTSDDVQTALATPAGTYTQAKLEALLSPAAQNFLEPMAQAAKKLTVQRFGRTIKLYAPLYLSNYCINKCLYCGFNHSTDFERTRLSIEEAVRDAEIIASEGFRDLLLVSSEDRKFITIDFLAELASKLRDKFSVLSIEIHQLEKQEYERLFQSGIEGVTLYQETYDRNVYEEYHKAGPKADYERRLRSGDDIAQAGMRELGLGALLGLNDWRFETLAMAEHAHYLMKRYWKSHVSFSFPRLRPAFEVESGFEHLLSDKELVQMMLALRLCFADAGLVLSTRESAMFRDNVLELGITRMSAGSKTNPGGYSESGDSVEQFQVDDSRSPAKVAQAIQSHGYEAVWKDWDAGFIP